MSETDGSFWDSAASALNGLANALRSTADDMVKANAEFASSSGLTAKIVRSTSGESCSWCSSVAGTYAYGSEPKDVYRRHNNCDCTVEYVTSKGSQNVHSKQWTRASEADKIKERKTAGLENLYLRRKLDDQGNEIIDKATYNKLTSSFIKNGGVIIRGEEAARMFKSGDATAAYFRGANVAFIRDEATVSDVLEEMFHARQDREGHFNEYPDVEIQLRREIEAQEYLLQNIEKYSIPESETESTRYWLNKYREDLRRITGEENG